MYLGKARGPEPVLLSLRPLLAARDFHLLLREHGGMLQRVELRGDSSEQVAVSTSAADAVRVPLRVAPSPAPWKNVSATWLQPSELPQPGQLFVSRLKW